MWSGRVSRPLDAQFDEWQRSFAFDCRLLPYECAASRAHARALHRAGVLDAGELQAILDGLSRIEIGPVSAGDAEDVHHYVEQQLVALTGETGYKLHTGRSRNEQIATDLRLFTRDAIARQRQLLGELCSAICDRGRRLGSAAMPSYTHMQRAEPVLAAHWLLAYVEMFLRDAERLADCLQRVNLLPLGSGAVAGCAFPLDRAAMARELGFDGVSANSMDATSDRDFVFEYLSALSLIALHLSRLAEDLALYATSEFGFVRLPDEFATGSSAMPQKKNPDLLELLRGKTGRVLAATVSVAVTMKGLPLAYNRDLQETQEPLFAASDSISESLPLLARFFETVDFDRERMQAAASVGHLNATAAANYLVRRGVPFRRAHEIVGRAVRRALERGCELEQLSLDELRQFSSEFDADIFSALELPAVLAEHDVPGGTAPGRVHDALAAAERRIAALREEVSAHA